MTHVELIEKILADYEKEWEEDPVENRDVKKFREGVRFAYQYLLAVLKNRDEWIYKD